MILWFATTLPATAQFGGDAFSAGDGKEYYVEFVPHKSGVELPKEDVEAALRRLYRPKDWPEGDPFAESGRRRTAARTNAMVNDRVLDGLVKIIFVVPNPALSSVNKAVQELHIRGRIRLEPAKFSFEPGGLSPQQVSQKIKSLEECRRSRVLFWRVFSDANSSPGRALRDSLCAEIYSEKPDERVMAMLYQRAAQFERDSLKRHLYLGKAAVCSKQWNVAWVNFEKVYSASPGDIPVIQDVVAAYRRASSRDIELCVWLTRFLKVTPHWPSFERAYFERATIEENYTNADKSCEHEPDICWKARKEPLRVYFPDADSKGFDHRLIPTFWECVGDWIQAMGGKMDLVRTDDRARADIICQWRTPVDYYEQFRGALAVPVARPRLPRIGETTLKVKNSRNGVAPAAAVIDVYAYEGCTLRTIDDNTLRAVCLHEVGHALGIRQHLQFPNDVMYRYCNERAPNLELSGPDKYAIFALYGKHPINLVAVDKFIGMRAFCERLKVGDKGREQIVGISSQTPLPFSSDAIESH